MTPLELLAQFRKDVDDREAPYLWDDDEFLNYLAESQDMFWRLVGGVQDASSAVTSVAYSAGDEFVALSPRLLKIKGVRRAADAVPVKVLNFEDLPYREGSDYGRDRVLSLDATTGEVKAMVLGMEDDRARLLYIPQAAGTLRLVVDRLPLTRVTDLNDETSLDETGLEHHMSLLLWVKHLAYSKEDSQTYDKTQAENYETRFRAYCAQARLEKERKKHKARVVAYGGL